ncbi:MAG: heparinase II/III family protein, partial [Balneolaceae bacterium]|nr:heparinase II/III family protein [Balneolaceae bacterium]
LMVVAPSGQSFNYADAGYGALDLGTRGNLAWFAHKTGHSRYLDRPKVQRLTESARSRHRDPARLSHAYLVWYAMAEESKSEPLPVYWKADGKNPVAVMRAERDENSGFYLGVKGGSASVNHANMDAGSFIFELGGVRWSVDPGNQSYNQLEQVMDGALWDRSQDSPRWQLLTKSNLFHSTLSVNGARHNARGFAPISEFQTDRSPEIVTIDLTEIFNPLLDRAERRFMKMDADGTLRVEDRFVPNDSTESVSWSMITRADVQTMEYGALLMQDGVALQLVIKAPDQRNLSVISLDPPPRVYDKRIPDLKKIDISIPGYLLTEGQHSITVELSLDRRKHSGRSQQYQPGGRKR